MITVRRFDASPLDKATKLPSGFLRVPAALTRAGIFEYLRADGSVQREYRPADEVLADGVLATLAGAPVTRDHPAAGMVTVDNVKALQVGHLDGNVRREADHAVGMMTITDAGVIADIEAGKLQEVSLGYSARLDPTPGTFNGQRYDAIQRGISYNHVAVGPKGWARGGPTMKIRLDGGDASMVGGTSPTALDARDPGAAMETVIFRLDGIDIKVEKSLGPVLERAVAERDAKIAAHAKELASAQGRFDAMSKELTDAKAALAKATDPKAIEAAVTERASLETAARKVLGAEAKFDGKTAHEVRVEVIAKAAPEMKLDGKSAEYVTAYFEAITSSAVVTKNDSVADAAKALADASKGAGKPEVKTDAAPVDPRAAMIADAEKLGREPLTFGVSK